MIPKSHLLLTTVVLTFVVLAACEPLAPAQTPVYIVVTGVTPDATVSAAVGALDVATGTPQPAAPGVAGVVNTLAPSPTPSPVATALPSPTPFKCAELSGRVIQYTLFSTVMGTDLTTYLYLPPCFYESLQRYPYVILLHGTGYDNGMWVDLGAPSVMDQGIANGTLPPMVLIMPDGGLLAELNDQPDDASFETVILDELIPAVERDFCLWASREARAIGGISRGGFWAFSLAFRHPDLFSAVGGHSPHFEEDNAGPDYNPLSLASRLNLVQTPLRIYLDHGANDYVAANVRRLSDLLRQNGIAHDYFIDPVGDHDMTYWTSHVAEYLSFYGQKWPRDIAALPSCLEPSP
ncbi:MAG: alpha/beta hydrolase [Aggregatilineaceae bacterium]